MLKIQSVKTTGDFSPFVFENAEKKNIIDIESERCVIASVVLNEPDLKCSIQKEHDKTFVE